MEASVTSTAVDIVALRDERRALVLQLNCELDLKVSGHSRSIYGAMESGVYRRPRPRDAEIAAARRALQDFDTSHPEVILGIKADQERARKSHEWD